MSTIEVQIWLALKSRIDTLVTSPVMTKFDPGAAITPPSDSQGPTPFILVSDSRNDNQRVTIGPEIHTRSGTLALSIQWPITRPVTHAQLVEIGGQVAAHFPADTRMKYGAACLRVTRDADVLAPYREGAYHTSIVRVPWTTK